MSKLHDRTKELIEQAKSLNLDSDEFSDDLVLQNEMDDEKRKKAEHAWKANRELARNSLALANEALKEMDEKKESKPAPAPAAQAVGDVSDQSAFYLSTLKTKAMQRLGISDPENDLVKLEIQRLYVEDATKAEARMGAGEKTDEVFNSVTSSFKLDDEDKEAIKASLGGLDILDQVNEDVIKRHVHTYMGANLDKFARSKKTEKKPGVAPAGAAAVSLVKSQGVEPGEGTVNGTGDEEVIEPPTEDELREMKKVEALDPRNLNHVKMFRNATRKRDNYTGH